MSVASGVGVVSAGIGAYLTVGDSQYKQATPFVVPANVKTVIPNNALDPITTTRFNMRADVWDAVASRAKPEFVHSVYSIRLSLTCTPKEPPGHWVRCSLETPIIMAISDTRPLLRGSNMPAAGHSFVFSWLVAVPIQPIVDSGAQFFILSDIELPIFDIRMAFFRVGG